MLDEYQEKQADIVDYFKKCVLNNAVSHAYLIEENNNNGYDFCLAIAKFLLCSSDENIANIIDNGDYPELVTIEPDGINVKKDQIVLLQHDFSMKPIYGKYKICIIKDADKLNNSSSNTILKFLEEPTEGVILFLIANNKYQLLNTIISRCQIISMHSDETNRYLDKDKIGNIVDIIMEFEEKKTNVLLNSGIYSFKGNLDNFFDIWLKFYLEILNYKNKKQLLNFIDYADVINNICSKLTLDDIINRVNVILSFNKYVTYNVNNDLFIDNFIVSLVQGDELNV